MAYLKLKFSRLICFVLFSSRRGVKNSLGSYVAPADISNQQSFEAEIFAMQVNSLLRPKRLVKDRLKRFGSKHDGGYFLIDRDYKKGVLISGGISNNNDFELDLGKSGLKVAQIDFSIDQPPKKHKNLYFYQYRISGNSKTHQNSVSLDEFLEKFHVKLTNKRSEVNILKLDIEGSEWDALLDFKSLDYFDQILLELHAFNDAVNNSQKDRIIRVLKKINQSHFPTYVLGNNCCGFTIFGGNPIANVMEVGFALRNNYRFSDFESPSNLTHYPHGNYKSRPKLNVNGIWGS